MGRTPADHGLGANEGGSIGDGAGRSQRGSDRIAVVPVDGGQGVPAVSLMGNALHHAAVAEEYIGAMIDDRVARAIEGRRERPLRESHAERICKALPERPGGGLDAQVHIALRMTGLNEPNWRNFFSSSIGNG